MKQNESFAPTEVLTWLQQKSFEQLNAEEKKCVLDFFTVEDYNDMHFASVAIADHVEKSFKEVVGKNSVLARFDAVHDKKNTFSFVPLFKVAAVLIPIALICALIPFLNQMKTINSKGIAAADTVYVTKTISEKELVHDTIFLEQKVVYVPVEQLQSEKAKSPLEKTTKTENGDPIESEQQQNVVRGNNMIEDTLWKKFEFTSM